MAVQLNCRHKQLAALLSWLEISLGIVDSDVSAAPSLHSPVILTWRNIFCAEQMRMLASSMRTLTPIDVIAVITCKYAMLRYGIRKRWSMSAAANIAEHLGLQRGSSGRRACYSGVAQWHAAPAGAAADVPPLMPCHGWGTK